MLQVHEVSKVVKFVETERRMVVSRVGRRGKLFSGYRVSVLKNGKF